MSAEGAPSVSGMVGPNVPSVLIICRLPASASVNHRFPSGPILIEAGPEFGVGTANSLTCALLASIRAMALPPSSVTHRLPSGPVVILSGLVLGVSCVSPRNRPSGAMPPTRADCVSTKYRLPSGPTAMPSGALPSGNWIFGDFARGHDKPADLVRRGFREPQRVVGANDDVLRSAAASRSGDLRELTVGVDAADLVSDTFGEPERAIRSEDCVRWMRCGGRNREARDRQARCRSGGDCRAHAAGQQWKRRERSGE